MKHIAIVLGAVCTLATAPLLAQEPDTQNAVERIERGNLVIEGIPDIPESVTARLSQYQNARTASFVDWAPDRGILIGTRFGETTQIHLVDRALGMRRQLTFFPEPIAGALTRPGHNQFAFQKDVGGNEQWQLYLYDLDTGLQTQLTDGDVRNDDPVFSPDGSLMTFSYPTDDQGNYTIAVVNPDDPSTRHAVYEGTGAWWATDINSDGDTAIIRKYVSTTEGQLALLDLETGETTPINPSEDAIAYGSGQFSAGGRSVFYRSNEGSEFYNLVRYDIESGEQTVLTEDINWSVESFDLAPTGSRAVISVNAGGLSELRIIDTGTGDTVMTPDLPAGVISGIEYDEDGRNVGFTLDAATSPDNAWSFHVTSGDLTQWTDSEIGGLDTSTFVEPDLIEFSSFDGLEVPAFVFRAPGTGPHPVLIVIHGGPESQYRPRFSSNIQFWAAEMGITVIAPNVRGSNGYGRTYVSLDNGYNREDSVRDIGALLDWVETQDDMDTDRTMVYGGSYGGYMVLASMVHYNDRLAGAIDVVGISNFVTFLENTQGYRRDLRRVEYGDERDPDMRAHLEAISPLNSADAISKPLFIIQGLNDPRVPAGEADQMLAAVRANNGEAWYLLATDEGHGFRKKSNRDYQYQAIALFLEQFLIGEE